MDPRALEKARSRLRTAHRAVADLKQAKSLDEFADVWFTFLTAYKSIYTTLEQGAKVSPQSRQWFGGKANKRRDDQLLQYLYQARNDDEHGLEESTEKVKGYIGIGGNKPNYSQSFIINADTSPGGFISARSLDGKPVLIEEIEPHVALRTVQGRGRHESYSPPQMHNGVQLISNMPLPVAELALVYVEDLLREAEGLK